jgi:hypothetical protein
LALAARAEAMSSWPVRDSTGPIFAKKTIYEHASDHENDQE